MILFTVLTVAFNVALPYVTGLPTTEISRNIANGESINFSYIFKCLIWITVVGIGYCISQLLSGVLMTNVVQSAMHDLRRDIEEKSIVFRFHISIKPARKYFVSCDE